MSENQNIQTPRKPVKRRPKKKKNKFVRFINKHLGFIIYFGALFVIAIGVLIVLWTKLDQYQKGQDIIAAQEAEKKAIDHAPQEFITNYVSNLSVNDWADLWLQKHPDSFDTQSSVVNVMQNLVGNNGYSIYKDKSYSKSSPVYLVCNSDSPIAKIALSGSEKNWNVADLSFVYESDNVYSLQVPNSTIVYLNDKAVNSEYITAESEVNVLEDYKDYMTNPITMVTYEVPNLLADPEVNFEGAYELEEAGENIYTYTLHDDTTTALSQKADHFVRTFLHYYFNGTNNTAGNMNATLALLRQGSPAYKNVSLSYDGITWRSPMTGINYDTTIDNVSVYADNVYGIDVTFHYKENSTIDKDITDGTIYTIYFMNVGNGFQIYDFAIN